MRGEGQGGKAREVKGVGGRAEDSESELGINLKEERSLLDEVKDVGDLESCRMADGPKDIGGDVWGAIQVHVADDDITQWFFQLPVCRVGRGAPGNRKLIFKVIRGSRRGGLGVARRRGRK